MVTVIGKWASYTNRVHKGNSAGKTGTWKMANLARNLGNVILNKRNHTQCC